MRKHVLLYGLLGGLLIAALRFIEYRWIVVEHSLEIYAALIAALFAGLGIWLGLRLTRRVETVVVREVPVAPPVTSASAPAFERDHVRVSALGLTARELQMLELVAAGLSNKEIAAREFVTENTVKTHLSRAFEKLGAERRTQAVQIAKAQRLIA